MRYEKSVVVFAICSRHKSSFCTCSKTAAGSKNEAPRYGEGAVA